MRKLALVLGGAAIAAVAAVAAVGARPEPVQSQAKPSAQAQNPGYLVLAAGDSAKFKGPKQPIYFRHDIHVAQYKMQCQYCHYSVDQSAEPGIPSMETCMGCHQVINGSDTTHKVEIGKLKKAWSEKKPIEWVRVHYLARHAHFPHQRHVKAMGPNACATCHGDISRMPQVYKVQNINNMGWCINCHVERKVSRDCSVCHY